MRAILLLAVMVVTPALAQQQPDPAMLQKAIAVLQQQRNEAMDKAAAAEVKASQLADELQKLKAETEKAGAPKDTPADK